MSKRRDQIAQIKKYTSGQLDAGAMHRLEREALDDPFLSDALEGYQTSDPKQEANLSELNDRLQLRIETPVRRLIPWKPLAIAASILIVIGIGLWLMIPVNKEKSQLVADNVKPAAHDKQNIAPVPASIPGTTDSTDKKLRNANDASQQGVPALSAPVAIQKQTLANNQNSSPLAMTPVKNDTSLYATTALGKPADKPAPPTTLNETSIAQQDVSLNKKASQPNIAQADKSARQQTLLQSKVEGLNVSPANRTLTGTVTGLDGTPLAGAVVKMSGTNFGAVTDENGRFVIHDVPEKKNLTVGYIGYSSANVRINGEDSVNVSLSPTSRINAGSNTGSMDAQRATDAHPSAGWKALQAYLAKNATLPDGQVGKVYLSFSVDGQGNLSNFKVLRSLSESADQKAIDLLVHGPGWVGNADGKAHEVKLNVEFR